MSWRFLWLHALNAMFASILFIFFLLFILIYYNPVQLRI